jgi:hypothetical protein
MLNTTKAKGKMSRRAESMRAIRSLQSNENVLNLMKFEKTTACFLIYRVSPKSERVFETCVWLSLETR